MAVDGRAEAWGVLGGVDEGQAALGEKPVPWLCALKVIGPPGGVRCAGAGRFSHRDQHGGSLCQGMGWQAESQSHSREDDGHLSRMVQHGHIFCHIFRFHGGTPSGGRWVRPLSRRVLLIHNPQKVSAKTPDLCVTRRTGVNITRHVALS